MLCLLATGRASEWPYLQLLYRFIVILPYKLVQAKPGSQSWSRQCVVVQLPVLIAHLNYIKYAITSVSETIPPAPLSRNYLFFLTNIYIFFLLSAWRSLDC